MARADAAWLHMDQPTNLMVITGVLWFDEPPDWDGVKERVRVRMVERFSRFRQRVVEGRGPLSGPHWEDDPDFDLERHFQHVSLPPPGDSAALHAYVADLTATPLDRSKALWEFHLVDGYEGGAALVGRVHHCIADGIALARVLLGLTDASPDAGIAPAEPEEEERPHLAPGPLDRLLRPVSSAVGLGRSAVGLGRTAAGLLAREALGAAVDRGHVRRRAGQVREGVDSVGRMLLEPDDPPTALKGELGIAQRVAWSPPAKLDDVKAMAHVTGTTVNDVLLAALAGALRRYLSDRGDSVDELTTFVPFNLRPLDRPLPADLGNRFGLVFLKLPVGIEDPRERLLEVHRRMQRLKRSPDAAVSYAVLDAIGRVPIGVERLFIGLFSAKGSAVTTNVPGPPQPVFLAGTPVRGVLVWAPCSGGVSMSLTIISYDGEVTLGVMTDGGLIPDPGTIVAGFERELEAYRDAHTLAGV
jgi:diacylglycerol O-acyltransferase / wax synthase